MAVYGREARPNFFSFKKVTSLLSSTLSFSRTIAARPFLS